MRWHLGLVTAALVIATVAWSAQARAEGEEPPKGPDGNVQLANGDTIQWGFVLSAVRFRVSRRDDQLARLRDYQPDVDIFSGQFGFQAVWNPRDAPFRVELEEGSAFQLFSVGFQIVGAIVADRFEQSELSITLSIGMLNNIIGIGLGVDLYRGIPTLGRDGLAGSDTAYTGLLAWAWASEGELTPENLVATLYLNITGIASVISNAAGGS